MFAFHDTRAGAHTVDIAFTDRHGGVSGGPYASLDLGDHAARSGELDINLGRVAEALTGDAGTPLALMRQVHGRDVAAVDAPTTDRSAAPRADALVTATPGLALVVRVADCVPVLLADQTRGVVGAVHAGRPGLLAGVVTAAVAALRDLGAEELVGWVGPHVCGACYEVPDEMREEVSAAVPESFATTSWGTPALDIGAGVSAQLRAAGVDVLGVGRCTREDDDLFSYRRQGAESGRLAGIVRVRP